MVEVQSISKKYGNKCVVDNVSIQIPKGKITSLIGPNGAGKSTVLSIVSRLIQSDAGSVLIEGKEIHSWPQRELAQKIAILKQMNSVNIRLTVRELVSFGRFPYSQGSLTKEDEHFIDAAIAYLDLQKFADQFIDQLSGGQRQRAYIAMVIAQNTDYIFLDEPLNNLDMKHSVQIMKTLKKLVQELGKTIVIVLHDINFASCYSDYIIAMKGGKVIREGETDSIIEASALQEIYDMNINIQQVDGNKIGVYFT